MSENRRYYWLKLQENFFDDDTIDFIESQENGEKYVLFYLKLCLKALKNEGKLIRYVGEMLLPFDDVGIAKLTRTDIDVVRSALMLFSKIGLIKKLDTGEIFLTQLNEMVGTETQKAKYMRQRRLEQKSNNVTPMLPECYTDIEIDIDKELEKEKEQEKENLCIPAYVPKINSNKNEVQTLINDCFTMIEEHNKTGKHKIPISKALMYFQQKEGRDILELLKQYETGEIKTALENYLKVADCDSWKSGFSFNAFFRNISEYTPAFFDISKYIDAPKNKEDVQAITEAFAEKNRKEKWFDYAVLHHHREDWIKAGKPEKEAFEKWADKVYAEDKENGINY